jgi:hypothetical protein
MTEVQGYIKDKETNEPLIGAHVILVDQYHGDMVSGTVTDATGFFSMEKRPATIAKVSYIGYVTSYPLMYTGPARDYYLERSDNELPEAVVIGTIEKPEFDFRILIGLGIVLAIILYLIFNK